MRGSSVIIDNCFAALLQRLAQGFQAVNNLVSQILQGFMLLGPIHKFLAGLILRLILVQGLQLSADVTQICPELLRIHGGRVPIQIHIHPLLVFLFPDFAIFAAKMQALCIAIGIAAGMQPILGYNYGSGQFKRVRKAWASLWTP